MPMVSIPSPPQSPTIGFQPPPHHAIDELRIRAPCYWCSAGGTWSSRHQTGRSYRRRRRPSRRDVARRAEDEGCIGNAGRLGILQVEGRGRRAAVQSDGARCRPPSQSPTIGFSRYTRRAVDKGEVGGARSVGVLQIEGRRGGVVQADSVDAVAVPIAGRWIAIQRLPIHTGRLHRQRRALLLLRKESRGRASVVAHADRLPPSSSGSRQCLGLRLCRRWYSTR